MLWGGWCIEGNTEALRALTVLEAGSFQDGDLRAQHNCGIILGDVLSLQRNRCDAIEGGIQAASVPR